MTDGAWRIVFLPGAGPEAGLGHVMRCLALARAAAAEGGRPSFVVSDARATALLRAAGFEVVPAPWPADPAATRATLVALAPETIVVDSYDATADFLGALRTATAQVIAVDDLAHRALPVDVVVNGGLGAERLPYRPAVETLLLLGPRYALLDAAFEAPPTRTPAARIHRVLICLGGGRHLATTLDAMAGVEAALPGCAVDVIAGAFAADADELDSKAGSRVTVHRDHLGLRDLMLGADVAVSGAGVTVHELSATGTPAVVIQMAGNQAPNAEAAERQGVALVAGAVDQPGLRRRLEDALRTLARDPALRSAMAERGRRLVDGQGARRVIHALTRPLVSRR